MTGDSSSFGRWFFYTEARLLVLIFVCLSAGIVTTGYFYYRAYEKHYRSDIERQLSSIADLKVGDLVQWRKERLDDANMLFRNPAFSSLMRREEQGDTEARRQLQTWVEKFQTANGYASASLIDAEGVTRTLSPTDPAPLSSTLSRRLPEVLRSGQFAFQDFYRDEHDKRIYLAMLIPILNESDGSHPLGVVVLRIDPATYLYPLIQRWPTPSSTAETLLVRREGNEVAFLNELRFQKNTALTLRAPLDRIMLPAAQAALGKEGIMDGIDYRGVQVVAILRSIPDSPWSLVTRIDAAEVYAPMREQLRMIAGLMGALLLSAGACVGLIWRQQRVRFFQARYEAQEDRAKLAAIVEFAEDAIIGKSLDGTITSWNPGAERLFGYQAAEMIGQPVTRIIPQDDQAHEAESLKRLQRGEAIVSYEGVRIAKDGRPIEVSLTVSPIRDSAGAIIGAAKIARDITERRRADDALRKSEERFRIAAETVNDVIYEWDLKQSVEWLGKVDEMLGYEPGEFPRTLDGWAASLHPEDKERTMAEIQAHLAGRAPYATEYRVRRKDGTYRWWSARGAVARTPDGKPVRWIGSVTDVTDQRMAEETLRQEEALFASLASTIPDHIYFKDRQSRFIRINGSMARSFKLRDAAEAVGKTDFDIFSKEHASTAFAEEQRIMETGEPMIGVEEKETWPDGHVTWVSTTKMPLRDAQDRITGMVGISRDITERKLADTQLREQYEILSNSHEGVMIVNLANEVSLWNRGSEEIFGWTAAEALGRLPEELLGIEDRETVSAMRAAAERDGFWNGEIRMKDRKNRNLIIDVRITLVRDEAARPRARLNFLADITEKKLLEEKFLHAQRLESIGMLAAGIAHDLNNVLAPIMFAEPLLRESLSTPRDLKILDTFKKCAARGAGLVRQILGFVHSTAGEVQPTQVKHIARDIVSVIEETFPKSIELQHTIPADLWPVLGNATQIHQVLLNLCVNARDAMPKGGTLGITAANRRLNAKEADAIPGGRPGAWLVLEVTDTGTGIPPDVLEQIWTPFFTTKDIGKGTGLGLSTVRGIVANHHGFVELHTEVGRGTTFRVFLPAVESELPQTSSTSPFDIPDGHGELILLVDDDAGIRSIATAILEKHGYRVVSCVDGVEAIVLFITRAGEISLVITDVDMPRLGGMELARTLSQIRPDIRLLAISGLSPDETGGSAVSAAIKVTHAFLLKPFDEKRLFGAVHRLLYPSEKT